MVRCTTCSLLIDEPWDAFVKRVGGPEKAEAYYYSAYFDPRIRDSFPFKAIYCYGQQTQFVRQLGSEFAVKCVAIHEMFGEEHDCRFYQISSGHLNLFQSITLYEQTRIAMSTPPSMVTQITGGTFIQSQVGTSGSTLNAYIEALQLNNYSNEAEHELKEALANLRRGIETDKLLAQTVKQAAATDLAAFSEEIKKPSLEQDAETKKFFWGRLSEATKFSASLVTLAAAVAKLTGIA
jgi:predicted HicB family RNase H-like nuclease